MAPLLFLPGLLPAQRSLPVARVLALPAPLVLPGKPGVPARRVCRWLRARQRRRGPLVVPVLVEVLPLDQLAVVARPGPLVGVVPVQPVPPPADLRQWLGPRVVWSLAGPRLLVPLVAARAFRLLHNLWAARWLRELRNLTERKCWAHE